MQTQFNSLIGMKMTNGLDYIRIKTIRNPNCIIANVLNTDSIVKLRKDDIKRFKKIKPLGLMSFFIVSIGNGQKDVIVTLHRISDMDKGEDIPYIAARQTMINAFAMPLTNNPLEIPYGMCMSQKTCPANVKFDIMLEHKKLYVNNVVCVYLDDTIETILPYINTTPYDSVIGRFKRAFDPQSTKNVGTSLEEFLNNNGWMSEFNTAYDIINIDKADLDLNTNFPFLLLQLEKSIERKILNILSIRKYDLSIDLSQIVMDECIFFRRSNSEPVVYMAKVTKGEPITILNPNQKLQYLELLDRVESLRFKK